MCEMQAEAKKDCMNVLIPALIRDIGMKSMGFGSGLSSARCDARHRVHGKQGTHESSYAFLERRLGCHGRYRRVFHMAQGSCI